MLALVAMAPPSRGIRPFRTEMGRILSFFMGVEHHVLLARAFSAYLLPKPALAVPRSTLRRAGANLIDRLPEGVTTVLIERRALQEGLQLDSEPFEPLQISDLALVPFPPHTSDWWNVPQNRLLALDSLSEIAESVGLLRPVTRRRERNTWRKSI